MSGYSYDVFAAESGGTQKPASTVDTVINHIRSQIFERKLRIGDRLPTEGELSELLGVGRNSVREAVKRLEAIQLLEVRRGDGTYIADLQEVTVLDSLLYKIVLENIDFKEILDYRIQLETGIMQLAIRNCTEDTLDELRNCSKIKFNSL